MVNSDLQKKIDRAIKLIQSAVKNCDMPLEIAYSGGKDSDIILQLARESGVKFRAIYKCTTIDPPGTIAHVLENGVEILRPSLSFAQLMAKKGQPSRLRRFCCEKLKEYKVMDRAVIGVRREESSKRAERYVEPTACRVYTKTKYVDQFFPILDWTLKDIVNFAEDRKIKFAPLYYDDHGNFHPERRLGCMCCPLASKNNRILEFKKYPGMVRFYIRAIQKYIDNHPKSKMANTYNAYEAFAHDVFFNKKGQWEKINEPGLFNEKIDWKTWLESYFGIAL